MASEEAEIKSAATVEDGSIKQTVAPEGGFEIKSEGDGRSYVEGYIATKDGYNISGEMYDKEALSEEALRSIASQINSSHSEIQNADVTFPDPSDIEATTGNIEHQSARAMKRIMPKLADTTTVPAVEMQEAEFDGRGVKVKAPIRENSLPDDTVEAIKNNIRSGILSAFSIEFNNAKDKLVEEAGRLKRKIKDVNVTGVGLTAQPKNPNTVMTAAELRSVMADQEESAYDRLKSEVKAELKEEINAEHEGNDEESEAKADTTSKASVKYRGTKEGKLDESKIDKEEHNLSDHYLFGEGEDKEDFSYPVVDSEMYLRRGNVEAAKSLGARGGVDASELERKLKELNDEFNNPPLTFKEGEMNSLGENMPEDNPDDGDGEPEGEPEQKSGNGSEEQPELKSTVEELKSTVEEVKSQNEELKQENEELKSKVEDFEEIEEMKSDIGDIEEELKSITADDQPVSDPNENRTGTEDDAPAELKAASAEFIRENKQVLAQKHNMKEDEVLDYVN